jgi:hypothetical protein
VYLVEGAVEGVGTVGTQQALDDLDRFFEAVNPDLRGVVGHPRLLVVGLHPPGTEAEFEASIAQHVEGGRLLGQDDGMPVVVPEDQGAHAERGGRGRHGGQGRYRR